ncbi:MAG TPA: hypothetical protein PKI92_01580 [Candidatus Woesebacteria bacterium]|nr:hypothetical protein [Candidatus Woesebacteria bacterium]HPR99319.1 hypothetical protein [Candidatus Woesebacteria bacterium]
MIKNKYLTQIEKTLDLYFGKKAPPIPENIKELIVKYSPYFIILTIVLTLAFGFRGFRTAYNFSPWGLLSLVALILEGMAIPGLLKRTRLSWEYLFYASLVSLLSNLLSINLGSLIIGGAISFYLLFQIKSYYKN